MASFLGSAQKDKPEFVFRPEADSVVHTFKYKGTTVLLRRQTQGNTLMADRKAFTPQSTNFIFLHGESLLFRFCICLVFLVSSLRPLVFGSLILLRWCQASP
jgi:hypothetical protein